MSNVTKIKVDGDPESSYQLYPRNEEFAKRSGATDTETLILFIKEDMVPAVLDAQTTANNAQTAANDAQTAANNAQTAANDAQTAANYAQTTAKNAQTTAKNAQTTAKSKMNANNPVGTGSFSMGRKADSVVGSYSHAEGNNTTASGHGSHAEGNNTTASGYGSHAEGNNTTASGYDSHAEGFRTTSSGDYSHAEGNNTTASSQYSHVQGKYNIADSQNKYAHIVGNGEGASSPSNAHTLDWNGVPWFKGRPQFGGTAQDQGSQTVIANGDKEIILASSTANSTKKFKITVDDSGTLTATEITQ